MIITSIIAYYLIAIKLAKLKHFKDNSTEEKPAELSSSLFSRSVLGIRTFSRASRFCEISSSE